MRGEEGGEGGEGEGRSSGRRGGPGDRAFWGGRGRAEWRAPEGGRRLTVLRSRRRGLRLSSGRGGERLRRCRSANSRPGPRPLPTLAMDHLPLTDVEPAHAPARGRRRGHRASSGYGRPPGRTSTAQRRCGGDGSRAWHRPRRRDRSSRTRSASCRRSDMARRARPRRCARHAGRASAASAGSGTGCNGTALPTRAGFGTVGNAGRIAAAPLATGRTSTQSASRQMRVERAIERVTGRQDGRLKRPAAIA